ncbi:Helix-turn-helix domain-containing protein [Salinihabitans flavidus]|uniref:Helix-turn-helix domain-containing protein n=1 Tax=Salinihabitans flavidus TaxID=569882 RepID=A0A1H8VZU4_9RHOB|nr:helix-turn-helix domain-containing protein [Salinihabitans flavidus]SEP20844.1 Helix-turn-helix domain-containing protein [Salinihabitans flavidus]
MTHPHTEPDTDPAPLLAEWISRDDLARELNLTPDTLGRWEARRQGPPCTRLGRKVFYRRASVQDWLRAQEQARTTRKHRGRK